MNIALPRKSRLRRRAHVGLMALGVSCLTAHLALAQAQAPPASGEAEPAAETEHPAARVTRPWLAEPAKKPLATGESPPFPWKSTALLVVIAALGAVAWRRRNLGRSFVKADRTARLSVLDSVRVGSKAQLVLTRVGDRTLLLGVTEDSVRRIAWIEQPTTGSAQAESIRNEGRPFLEVMRAESARAERGARNSSRPTVPASPTSAAALPPATPPPPSEAPPSIPEAISPPTSAPSTAAPVVATAPAAEPSTTAPVAAMAPTATAPTPVAPTPAPTPDSAAPPPSFANAALEIAKSSNDTVEWSRSAPVAPRSRRPRSTSSQKRAKAAPAATQSPIADEASKAAPIESPVGDLRGSEPAAPEPTTTISESRALGPNKATSRSELPDGGMEGQAAGVVQRRSRRRA